ncbi:hypothetical protein AZJ54_05960 [Streptococcus pneumoniae]|nr:hypothetical protein AZJ54_05960 [Streptococcus pneumoniae]
MILMTKNINLTNEELELIQGGADPYGKNPKGRYDWEIERVLTLPGHGLCHRGTYDLGYIGGGYQLCKGRAARFYVKFIRNMKKQVEKEENLI